MKAVSPELNAHEHVCNASADAGRGVFKLISYLNSPQATPPPPQSPPDSAELLILLFFTITYYKLTSATLFPN